MQRNEFVEYIIGDQLAGLHGMSARAMFGGFGVYQEGIIVGIIIADELYLKVDETNQGEYESMGSAPFHYSNKDKKKVTMSYWKVPDAVVEDRARLVTLVEDSYDISLKKSVAKNKRVVAQKNTVRK